MQLPVTTEVMLSELKTAKAVIEAWEHKLEAGIPGVDLPAAPEVVDDFLRALCGELLIVSSKCENLSRVLSGEP